MGTAALETKQHSVQAFVRLALTTMFLFLVHGHVQERWIKAYNFNYSWVTSTFEVMFYTILAYFKFVSEGGRVSALPSVPWSTYTVIAFGLSFGRGLTWLALTMVSFPIVLIGKSAKLLAVMAGSLLFLGKRHSSVEYGAALLIITGLSMFSWADIQANSARKHTERATTPFGVFLVILSLFFDSAASNFQEKAMKMQGRGLGEVMLVTNAMAMAMCAVIAAFSGQIYPAASSMSSSPGIIWMMALTFVLGYAGTTLWTIIIRQFGAVAATGVGITRKFFSLLMSFFFFPKPVIFMHFIGASIFFTGLCVSLVDKTKQSRSKSLPLTEPAKVSKQSQSQDSGPWKQDRLRLV